jgi:transporter family-2 protein
MYSRSLSALAFTADFPPAAPKFHQRTHRVRLRNLGTTDKKSSRKIKRRKTPRVHKKQQEEKSMAGILTALLSGALMSIQGVFNTEVTKQTSTWLAAGWVQISAFVVCLAAWCITGREPIGDLFRVKPWYLLLGGAIGAFITITVIWSMAGLGPAKAAMLIVISQLAAAWLIELFGLFGMEKTDFTVRKLLGMAVAVVGIVVFQWE